jgi:hypothetical protein
MVGVGGAAGRGAGPARWTADRSVAASNARINAPMRLCCISHRRVSGLPDPAGTLDDVGQLARVADGHPVPPNSANSTGPMRSGRGGGGGQRPLPPFDGLPQPDAAQWHRQRFPARDGPGAPPRLCVVYDAGKQPAQLDGSRELATTLEGSADRSGIGLGDAEHPRDDGSGGQGPQVITGRGPRRRTSWACRRTIKPDLRRYRLRLPDLALVGALESTPQA